MAPTLSSRLEWITSEIDRASERRTAARNSKPSPSAAAVERLTHRGSRRASRPPFLERGLRGSSSKLEITSLLSARGVLAAYDLET